MRANLDLNSFFLVVNTWKHTHNAKKSNKSAIQQLKQCTPKSRGFTGQPQHLVHLQVSIKRFKKLLPITLNSSGPG